MCSIGAFLIKAELNTAETRDSDKIVANMSYRLAVLFVWSA